MTFLLLRGSPCLCFVSMGIFRVSWVKCWPAILLVEDELPVCLFLVACVTVIVHKVSVSGATRGAEMSAGEGSFRLSYEENK